MSFSAFFALAIMIIPIIPALLEIFRGKDKGPRKIPEETIYKEKRDISKPLLDLERLRASARMKGPSEVIRIVGDISIPDGTEMKQSIVVHGSLKIGERCRLYGNIKSSGEIEVGEESVIEGHVLSDGKVTIGPKAAVKGIVDSAEDIILEEEATVEAVSTRKSVTISSGARIHKEIRAGTPIHAVLPPTQETRPETPIMAREGIKEEDSIAEVFENLLASKMREEVTKKNLSEKNLSDKSLAVVSQGKKPEATADIDVSVTNSSEERPNDAKTTLRKWLRAFSHLFGEEKKTEEDSFEKSFSEPKDKAEGKSREENADSLKSK